MKEAIRRFYQEWEPDLLLEVIGEKDFGRREFAVAPYSGPNMIRNLFFENVDELKKYLIEIVPIKAYVGSVYVRSGPVIPSGKSVGELSVDYRELTFDIDLTDYNDVRREIEGCRCRMEGKKVCPKCRPLANRALVILRRIAEDMFGTTRYKAFFSGRRGVHFRIYDENARKLAEEERYKLAAMLQVVHPSASLEPAKVLVPAKSHSLRLIVFEETVLYRVKKEGSLHKLSRLFSRRGIRPPRGYRKDLEIFLNKGVRNASYHEFVERVFNEGFEAIKDIIRKYYVRIDLKALTDSKRLMKIPGSLDASTMAVVEEIPKEEFETRMPEILRRQSSQV